MFGSCYIYGGIGERRILVLERKAVSGIMLTLLLIGMLTLAFNIQPVKAEPRTWIVDDDGPADFHTIQEAINAASDNDTIFVKSGKYYENLVINKKVALFGESKDTTEIEGVVLSPVWESVISIRVDDVEMANFTVTNGGHGIYLGAKRSIVTDCVVYENHFGLTISSSSQNLLRRNQLFNNSYNLLVLGGWSINDFMQDIDTSNFVNGKPVYYLVNEDNLSINPTTFPNIGYLGVINSTNVQIANLSLSRNGDGLLIAFSPDTLVENVEAIHNYHGISLMCSPRTTVKCCNFSYNDLGIFLYYSDDVNIKENNISHNDEGIFLMCSNYDVIYHNNFVENYRYYQARVDQSYNCDWNDGYPSGGNYWSDYVGVDVKSGPNQDLPGSDGIGDKPYIIDTNNRDRYPLIIPYGAPPPPAYTLTITTTVGGTTNSAPGTYSYTANSLVQVTAIPSTRYLFDHWELDSVNIGSANPYTVLMDKNHTLKAFFSPIPPPLSASINPLSASILAGQSVTFTSTVSGGYTPYSYQWYLNGNPVSGATSSSWAFTPTASGINYVHLKVADAKANIAQSETARIAVAAVPVGGYSLPIKGQNAPNALTLYLALIAILATVFTAIKRKIPNKK
jgi:parallel beta-helix repeat protein